MNTLTFHITDIASNSVRAGATRISLEITIHEDHTTVRIADNGCGMDAETVSRITNSFYTTGNPFPYSECRTNRRSCQHHIGAGKRNGGNGLLHYF